MMTFHIILAFASYIFMFIAYSIIMSSPWFGKKTKIYLGFLFGITMLWILIGAGVPLSQWRF